jgi:hypothetical protein
LAGMGTFLQEVKGFTPVIDVLARTVGWTTAAVYGVAWRYCQMQDGVCKAAQETIADHLGVCRDTVKVHLDKLCECGYLEDLTPGLQGRPHVYKDTGKVKIIGLLSVEMQENSATDAENLRNQLRKIPATDAENSCIRIVSKIDKQGEKKEDNRFAIFLAYMADQVDAKAYRVHVKPLRMLPASNGVLRLAGASTWLRERSEAAVIRAARVAGFDGGVEFCEEANDDISA